MNSKQQSLVYLMEESQELANLCMRQVHAHTHSKAKVAMEQQVGKFLSALKEAIEEFKLNGDTIEGNAEHFRRIRKTKI